MKDFAKYIAYQLCDQGILPIVQGRQNCYVPYEFEIWNTICKYAKYGKFIETYNTFMETYGKENLKEILKIAHKFKMTKLLFDTGMFLCKHITNDNLLEYAKIGKDYNHPWLVAKSMHMLLRNGEVFDEKIGEMKNVLGYWLFVIDILL